VASAPDRLGGSRPEPAGFTLLEILVSVVVLTVGVLGVVTLFSFVLRANEEAELRTIGAALAMMKIEEIRRDNDRDGKLLEAIRMLEAPTDPVPFALEGRLAYRFSSTTLLYLRRGGSGAPIDDPDDPRDDPGVARVIIQESPEFKPRPKILDEYRFQ